MNLPQGYRYAACYAGLRKERKDDVALIVPDEIAAAAAVFTRNIVQAAPVRLARKHLKSSKGRVAAVLINAGNANCATRTGDRAALESCKAVAKALKSKTEHILPASTGVIGVELPSNLLSDVAPKLVTSLSYHAFDAVAQAILTTDRRMKRASEEVRFGARSVRIAGLTKGSGMIHPNMATTLGFIMTDAAIDARDLHAMLVRATDHSYNCLSVDGDMSTNDMVALLANGASGVKPGAKERKLLEEALGAVMQSLARQIAADGEGARKLILIEAAGFRNEAEARAVSRAIANSPLVKTAIAGSDPNWGRILAAAGYSGIAFDPADIDIYLQDVPVCRKGLAANFDEMALKQKLDATETRIRIVLSGRGRGRAHFFTCDLTEGYIQINGSYRT